MIHVGIQSLPVRTPTSVLASRIVTRNITTAAVDDPARNGDGGRAPPTRSRSLASVSVGGAIPAAKLGRLLGILIDLLDDNEVAFALRLLKDMAASPTVDANMTFTKPEFDSFVNESVDKFGDHLRNSTLEKLGCRQKGSRQSAPASRPERSEASRHDVAPPPRPIEPAAAGRQIAARLRRFGRHRSSTTSRSERASNSSQDIEAVTECRPSVGSAHTAVHSRESQPESETEARRSTELSSRFVRMPPAAVRGPEAGPTTAFRRSMEYFRGRFSRTTTQCQDFDRVCVSHSSARSSHDQIRLADSVPESDADKDGEHETHHDC